MSALDDIHRKLLNEMTSAEIAIWYTSGATTAYDMEQAAAELAALTARLAQAERVVAIAQTIYDVTSTGYDIRKAKECPHGNFATPPYNHSWWCDDCWNELGDALKCKQP